MLLFLGDIPSFDDHLNSLFKISQIGPLATSIQSLTLLYQVMEKRTSVSSRFYRALYRKLSNPQLSTRTGQQVCVALCLVSFQSLFVGHVFESAI